MIMIIIMATTRQERSLREVKIAVVETFAVEERLMLVISRRIGESLIIGNNIVVTVIDIQPTRARLQVESAEEFSIQLAESGDCTTRGGDWQAFVCSRRKNESIVINRDITIMIIEIRDDKVRLGSVMPRECPCHRKEVWDAIHSAPKDLSD
jgi:carbon storage regulator